ncbi:monofunctional biosynthetic peptidoglycan transglycosylase [Larsenimonas salina]|uniref:monofunctional biosynthetic peptidoglycan transglycosylase n=1 Tax=Larsenimonas salina TaxID=1295565 RepID=UPI002073B3CF|nr:monofunctional biosynthetic peptidoglycan transglycosylase [Larsenimonas salina]MCM5703892.1 monofunctional biosynthetic peptidoglycan transglycosylase [Larsenimonas salina]
MSGIKTVATLLKRWLIRALLTFVVLSIALVLVFRVVPPPRSMVMLERQISASLESRPFTLNYQWRAYDALSDQAKLAVIASEDQRFPFHYGIDFKQIRASIDRWVDGGSLRGASTISQQTARNLFLWTGRSWVRKGLEVWFTGLIELLWPKQRILEVYLNIAEWDAGVFGLEAASQHYFNRSSSRLTPSQAARLAAVLPAPDAWSPVAPSARVSRRAVWIQGQMRQLGGTRYLETLEH